MPLTNSFVLDEEPWHGLGGPNSDAEQFPGKVSPEPDAPVDRGVKVVVVTWKEKSGSTMNSQLWTILKVNWLARLRLFNLGSREAYVYR